MPSAAAKRDKNVSGLQFEFGFIFFQEFAEFIGRVKQTDPLLVVKRDRKAAEAIDTDSALFSNAELKAAGAPSSLLLFKFGQTRF